jgi:competence protein ComX
MLPMKIKMGKEEMIYLVKNVVQYLVQHPEVIDQVKAGKASFIGLSEKEQKAVLDVFSSRKNIVSKLTYWQ